MTDPLLRSFKLPGQQKVNFRRDPRYGTWSVSFDKGGMAPKLQGQYTSFQELYNKVDFYLRTREKFKCSIGEEILGVD